MTRTRKRRAAVFLSGILILFSLATGFHYHTDNENHDDCQVCAASGHSSAVTADTPALLPERSAILPVAYEKAEPTVAFYSFTASRAPPLLSL